MWDQSGCFYSSRNVTRSILRSLDDLVAQPVTLSDRQSVGQRLSAFDQSMFENSVAQQQSPQISRPGQPSARRTPASANSNLGSSSVVDSPSTSSHISFDSFPRLDPPPPSGKKRLPRALKTTQDMMISSDPVVSSPDAGDSSSFLSSPGKTPLISQEEEEEEDEQRRQEGEKEKEGEGSADIAPPLGDAEQKVSETTGSSSKVDGAIDDTEADVEEDRQHRVQLSVPDLINKDPPLPEPRANRPCDIWQKAPAPDSRLASTPRSGKTACRISLGEEVLLGNGAPCGKDEEPHPDLLSFE
ncbi:hypothetical protein F2P81_005267 [Scophthalmus maximus]|uniref:Uncharacterized protein n=1 Tax=Scophthalmus maximus TaxID=52904 RepID=A0A6A4T957_SCOMX|nr:hypothetical protein F2P81_005267 [Scophthalmus maximus]